ncbi:MAG: ATP-binding protein [Oscillospiraceae bacterium]|nr:ATP-binding protein [Oscillospiraceae bacterium]
MQTIRPPNLRRITIVTGHYGSGKTEFAVNLALRETEFPSEYGKRAVCDLDLVNPYFRSRERRDILESRNIEVHGSTYRDEITAEIPALGASVRAPLENRDCRVIVDAGGNDSGALVLKQFGKYFTREETDVLAVLNFCRYETRTAANAIAQIRAIEAATRLAITGLVGNTHLLRQTDADTVRRGASLTRDVADALKVPITAICYPEEFVRADELAGLDDLFPLKIYMRDTWMDR